MLKIVTDDECLLEEMSENLTELSQPEACSNCADVKEAVKTNSVASFCRITGVGLEEAAEEMANCKKCMWYYIDEVEFI